MNEAFQNYQDQRLAVFEEVTKLIRGTEDVQLWRTVSANYTLYLPNINMTVSTSEHAQIAADLDCR